MNPGTRMLQQMARARRFNRWMADAIAPYVGERVLEIGAGLGNLTEFLSANRTVYVATDTDNEHLDHLRTRFAEQRNVQILACDAADPSACEPFARCFDTVVCLNVLEHIADDAAAIANIFATLRPGGRAVVLVPQGRQAFGSWDELLDHKRRYTRAEITGKITRPGFQVDRVFGFNRATYPAWIINARLLRRQSLGSLQLKLFDLVVPLCRRVDRFLPWPPTSLIAIGVRE
jgi:2-polyprenyl-3-methyl-5-hydroxy-6-metoxy-1,4-benzoquinol methylase